MKKLLISVLLLACVMGVTGCKSDKSASDVHEADTTKAQESQQAAEPQKQQEQNAEAAESQQTAMVEESASVISPLPLAIDIADLEDCTAAVSLEEGDFYTDETGAVMMDVTVFAYDLYDMVDISLMEEGDTILRAQEEVLITLLERSESGLVLINGGLDEGGFNLYTEENTVYYELGYNDAKFYYALGKVSLPVSPDFVYNDAANLDYGAACFSAEDFLNGAEGIDYHFNANNTTLRIEAGYAVEMTRVYTP